MFSSGTVFPRRSFVCKPSRLAFAHWHMTAVTVSKSWNARDAAQVLACRFCQFECLVTTCSCHSCFHILESDTSVDFYIVFGRRIPRPGSLVLIDFLQGQERSQHCAAAWRFDV